MTIKEEFEKSFELLYGKKPETEYTPSGECEAIWHWTSERRAFTDGAKWAFERAANVAAQHEFRHIKNDPKKNNPDCGSSIGAEIRQLAKELQ